METFWWVISIVLAGIAIWFFLPRAIFLFRSNAFSHYFDDNLNTSLKTIYSDVTADLVGKIKALGFSELLRGKNFRSGAAGRRNWLMLLPETRPLRRLPFIKIPPAIISLPLSPGAR